MKNQFGVGLVEVLVALLLVSIGVLGFVALQYRAAEAGGEASHRVLATEIARDIAERVRVNNSDSAIQIYKAGGSVASVPSCYTNECNDTQRARFDLAQTTSSAQNLGMALNITNCPVNVNKTCIYVAWDKTSATSLGDNSCTETNGNRFSYRDQSTCVVMEAF